jgi:hypothetical protein
MEDLVVVSVALHTVEGMVVDMVVDMAVGMVVVIHMVEGTVITNYFKIIFF